MWKLLFTTFCLVAAAPSFSRQHKATTPKRPLVHTTVSELSQNPSLKSVQGNEIGVLRIPALSELNKDRQTQGQPVKTQHRFYIQGGLHGDETQTTEFVNWLATRIAAGKSPLNAIAAGNAAFDFVPAANPDGAIATDRYNKNRINLNRNFGHLWGLSRENPGPKKFSEPETRAIKYLIDQQRYTAAVDVHGYINWLVAPSAPEGNASSQRTLVYDKWMTILADEMQAFDPTYELKTAKGLGDGGAFEDYAFWEVGTKAVCLEMATAFRHIYQMNAGQLQRVDLYENYEKLIYRLFKRAIDIDESGVSISQN